MLALALASYLSLYPALLLPPLLLLCHDQQEKQDQNRLKIDSKDASKLLSFIPMCFGVFIGAISGLLYISYLLTGGSWEFLSSTYGVQLLLPDLTPNVGLWWYFFIEMFDSFREFFLGVFWLHLAGYVGGLCLRIRKQPLFVITTMLGICAVFKPYPSISDVSLYFGLLPLYRHVFPCKSFLPVRSLVYPNIYSNAIHLLCGSHTTVCHSARARVLLSVDIRRFWQCQLLLRHHSRLEPGTISSGCRLAFRCTTR